MNSTLEKICIWQMNQLAKGDYTQRMRFEGEFADAFNLLAQKLEERTVMEIKERSRLQDYINLILASTPDLIIVFDTNGKTVLTSRSFVRDCAFASNCRVRGKTLTELFAYVVPAGFIGKMKRIIRCAATQKRTASERMSVDLSGSGNVKTYSIHATPMLYEGDVLIGVMVVLHDIG